MKILHFDKLLFALIILFLSACSANRNLAGKAKSILLSKDFARHGNMGISIFDPSSGKYLYRYNEEKYFIPASNMKLFTLYAGLRYLGDSLPGLKILSSDTSLVLYGTGDPTFLHPDFKSQPVFDYLKKTTKSLWYDESRFSTSALGSGWSWDDYSESYLNERSELPVFGNNITFYGAESFLKALPVKAVNSARLNGNERFFTSVKRNFHSNDFVITSSKTGRTILTPFITSLPLSAAILADTLDMNILPLPYKFSGRGYSELLIRSRPTDSLLVPMMHNSDNFFSEQVLQMISVMKFGKFDEQALIDSVVKNDLPGLPQPVRWVDGSGLSRYNLVTANDFIYILNKIINEFGIERLKSILPTGGEGTLRNYYKASTGYIYAKTGTLSNNCSLSGFIITKKNKILLFSVIANNYQGPATPVRRSVEQFLEEIRNTY